MTIPSSFIDQILDQSDIVDIVGRRVQLTKKGSNFWGLCPFHDDHKPSMAVNQDKQFYYCFVCGAKGNSINFLRNYENLDFVDAVETIASTVGLEVPREKTSFDNSAAININSDVAEIFKKQLTSEHGKKAISYLKKRGISGETAKFFEIGFSLDSWTALYDSLKEKFEDKELIDSGLFSDSKKDRFRNRIMYPIKNLKGDHIGFGGRIIDEGEPKYLNSPETKTFSKSKELYGLYEAKKNNQNIDTLFVVEGYMDVIALYENGIKNAVASLGTAITGLHISKLMRYAKQIYITFDGDLAGRKAAWRAVENALPILREDIKMSFIFLDEGQDPDSYVNENGKDEFLKLTNKSIPLSEFFIQTLKDKDNLDSLEGRTNVAKFALPYIKSINNETIKQAYIQEISNLCNLDFSSLLANNKKTITNQDKDESPRKDRYSSSNAKKSVFNIFISLIQYPSLSTEQIFDEIKTNSSYKFIRSIQEKYKENEKINPSAVLESIKEDKIKNLYSEALVSEIILSKEDAKSMLIDCISNISQSGDDRLEILKEKYNIGEISSSETRELQKLILLSKEISKEDQTLLKELSSK